MNTLIVCSIKINTISDIGQGVGMEIMLGQCCGILNYYNPSGEKYLCISELSINYQVN